MWTISSIILMLFVSKATANPINYVSQTQNTQSSVQPIPLISSTMSRKSIKRTPSWNQSESVNPEELGDLLEGDIATKLDRNGVIQPWQKWYGGIVPYEILGPFTDSEMEMIESAIDSFHKHTCIRFRKINGNDKDYVSIVSTAAAGCWSFIGRQEGKQKLQLSPRCFNRIGTPIHELMHAVGFYHEQARWDRDWFVTVIFENIEKELTDNIGHTIAKIEPHLRETIFKNFFKRMDYVSGNVDGIRQALHFSFFIRGHEKNFKKVDKYHTSSYGLEYDFESLLHYSRKAFSSNGMDTIITKDPTKSSLIGQRYGFSRKDIMKLNRMYRCVGYDVGKYRGGGNEIYTSSNLLTLIVGWNLATYMVNYIFI